MAGDYLDQVFGPGGHLAHALPGYVTRPGQITLARAVDNAIRAGQHLMAEGPTGTGKSIGYAVPLSHHVAMDGRRAIIATANIALQEQLVRKDLPLLAAALPWDVSYALLKGRNNYLCLDRLAEVEAQPSLGLGDTADEKMMDRAIRGWARGTEAGDVSELPFEPPARVWLRFAVHAEDCPGPQCRQASRCYALRARAAAGRASIVVTNYHLLFAHLEVREETEEDLVLPPFDLAVLDEAHKAADIARDFFGFRLTAGATRAPSRLLGAAGHEGLAARLETEAGRYFDELLAHRRSPEYRSRLRAPEPVLWTPLFDTLGDVAAACESAAAAAQDAEEHAALARASRRASGYAAALEEAMTLADEDAAYYIDLDARGRAALCGRPLDVAARLARTLFARTASVTVTSATLTTAGTFEYVSRELGLEAPRQLIAESPFDFVQQALLVVPERLPDPTDPAYPQAVADAVAEIIDRARGRTLGLFTSYRNLNLAYERVAASGHRVLRQGDLPRTALLDEFRRDVHSVLLGTESFWGGVDVPGESLSCVIIDRLPFPTPDDPLLDAIGERDPSCFHSQSLPRAVIAFKQGFGRLIRTGADRGVVVVLDRRLLTRPYGRVFLASLPDVPVSRDLASIDERLG
ncbi:MAG TPA: helicase C-terminal domain-containing protein [Polyangia bacterium]|jgi:ATP-dependent DNA helicase DinG